jgi:glyoxylase-like metal-dependent hydrolase (beta-lactamase superfamily II)
MQFWRGKVSESREALVPLRIYFHGASRAVTGSCFLLETELARVLVYCGLFQGAKSKRELNYRPFPFKASNLDAVCLTHAHIDHSGLLPKLTLAGFDGSPYLKDDHERRLAPASVGRQDWNNDFSKLILDINEAVEQAADRRTKSLILRRLRRALTERDETS